MGSSQTRSTGSSLRTTRW